MYPAVHKTMDRDDLAASPCAEILDELFALMRRMRDAGLDYSSWYGRVGGWPSPWEWINRGPDYEPWPGNPDEVRVPWFLLWEICWIVAHARLEPASRVLDMGGAASLFACFLASRGHDVHTIDLNPDLVAQTAHIARQTGWRLTARHMDMQRLDYPDEHFDHVFSLCVLEHLPVSGRIVCSRGMARVLRQRGTAGLTFDYANPQAFARLGTPAAVRRQITEPSGLMPMSPGEFLDNGKRYLLAPPLFGFGRLDRFLARSTALLRGRIEARAAAADGRYTFGAMLLQKRPPG